MDNRRFCGRQRILTDANCGNGLNRRFSHKNINDRREIISSARCRCGKARQLAYCTVTSIDSCPQFGLRGPGADFFTNSIRQSRETQSADLSTGISPGQLANGYNSFRRVKGEADMKRPILYRTDGVETQAAFGNIREDPAVVRWQAEVSEFMKRLS